MWKGVKKNIFVKNSKKLLKSNFNSWPAKHKNCNQNCSLKNILAILLRIIIKNQFMIKSMQSCIKIIAYDLTIIQLILWHILYSTYKFYIIVKIQHKMIEK